MGVEQSYPYTPQQNDPSFTKSTSSDNHTHYSKCDSLPTPQTVKSPDQTCSYPKSMTSSSPPRFATQQYAHQQPIACDDGTNEQIYLTHCSMPPEIPKNEEVADRYYPINLHESLPLDFRAKKSSGRLARQVFSEEENFPQRISPFQQIETISSKSNSTHRSKLYESSLYQSVPQLVGYNHVNNVKSPSFTENAGLLAYMECSQTLDDLFSSQMRIHRRSLISSSHKGSMQSSIAKGFKKT